MSRPVAALVALLLATAIPGAVSAQSAQPATEGMSANEMAEAFKKQKTRGLVLVPVGQAPAGSGTAVSTTPPATATAVALDAIPRDEQVNINISFDFDSAALRADQKPKLEGLCNAVTAAEVQVLRIVGHTDASGSDAYNERLSQLRAEEVKRHLVSTCGIPADRLEAVGVGKRYLFDPANPRGDVNRRVEFQALG